MPADRDVQEETQYTTEALAVYCFDFSKFPEVLNGETLGSPAMATVANVTQGAPTVLTSEFREGSATGSVTVAAGKGVKVAVTCTTVGRYTLACSVLMSGGTTRTRRLVLNVE